MKLVIDSATIGRMVEENVRIHIDENCVLHWNYGSHTSRIVEFRAINHKYKFNGFHNKLSASDSFHRQAYGFSRC